MAAPAAIPAFRADLESGLETPAMTPEDRSRWPEFLEHLNSDPGRAFMGFDAWDVLRGRSRSIFRGIPPEVRDDLIAEVIKRCWEDKSGAASAVHGPARVVSGLAGHGGVPVGEDERRQRVGQVQAPVVLPARG
jgi:hypothetical protein